jgi:hypothetical protein
MFQQGKDDFLGRCFQSWRVLLLVWAQVIAFGQETTNTSASIPAYKIPTNTVIEFTVPLSQASQIAVANSRNGLVYLAKVAIAVPVGFSTNSIWPILVVNASSDGDGSSVRTMRAYTNIALQLGWVVLAADGPFGRPTNDSPPWRYAMLSSALEHVNRSWPGSRRWPIVSAGVSGGAKWAGVMGAALSQRGYNLIGVFMAACNEDLASQAAKLYYPATRYKATPIWLSSGTLDTIATPEHHREVMQSLLANGFTQVRLQSFEGPHMLNTDELRKALEWFLEVYKTRNPAAAAAENLSGTATPPPAK